MTGQAMWDIGWVPDGWTKGEQLEIFDAMPGFGCGSVRRHPFTLDNFFVPGDELAYVFNFNDREKAQSWVQWWFTDEV